MPTPDAAITDNLHYLHQAAALLDSLTPAQFTHARPPMYVNGVGPHLRHCLDHYELFLGGWQSGRVDYDLRSRRDAQQRDPAAMRQWLLELTAVLKLLSVEDLSSEVEVKMDCGTEMSAPWSKSSVLRELQFLISHTVHHFALIAMILHDQHLPVPAGFGVAPSTLKFEAEKHTCAQ